MASVSISDPPLSSKKKRTNGTAKLKQIKLDVRREQWLSRVKKGGNVDSNGRDDYCPSSKDIASEENQSSYKESKRKEGDDVKGTNIYGNVSGSMIDDIPVRSTYDRDESSCFTGSSCSSSSSITSSSNMSTSSRSVSEEEGDDDGCLDDWEAVADALYASNSEHSFVSETHTEHEMQSSYVVNLETTKNSKLDLSNQEFRSAVLESHPQRRAWKSDDALRPRCLPNLSKQHSSPLKSSWCGNHKAIPWTWKTIISQPSQCPICYEDLDMTDSSFLPCSCGFRLCLFCHKKILEADGRCPGCRKLYDHVDANVGFNIGTKAFYITQSCSMSTGC